MEIKVSTARDFVKNLVQLFPKDSEQRKYWDWLMDNGTDVTKPKFMERKALQAFPKSCYYNAQLMAIEYKDLDYYEGWATPKGLIPLEHAWCMKDGKIIDPTWKDATDYFGVKIPTDFIRKHWIKTGMSDALLSRFFRKEVENGTKL